MRSLCMPCRILYSSSHDIPQGCCSTLLWLDHLGIMNNNTKSLHTRKKEYLSAQQSDQSKLVQLLGVSRIIILDTSNKYKCWSTVVVLYLSLQHLSLSPCYHSFHALVWILPYFLSPPRQSPKYETKRFTFVTIVSKNLPPWHKYMLNERWLLSLKSCIPFQLQQHIYPIVHNKPVHYEHLFLPPSSVFHNSLKSRQLLFVYFALSHWIYISQFCMVVL